MLALPVRMMRRSFTSRTRFVDELVMLPTPQPTPSPAIRSADLAEHVKARLRARSLERAATPLAAHTDGVELRSVDPPNIHSPAAQPTSGNRPSSADLMQQLSAEVRRLETAGRPTNDQAAISCGCAALDNCLPDGGYLPGSVIEYLRAMPGCGASLLAFSAAAVALRVTGGFLVVVDTQHNIYPPSLASLGIDLEKVVWVRPQSDVDALWAVDQSLRTAAVAAVVADVERIDDRAARRMQLAAEQGGGLAMLLRPASARRGPSWAEIQWLVRAMPSTRSAPVTLAPSPIRHVANAGLSPVLQGETPARTVVGYSAERRLQVQLVRVRGGKAGALVRLQVDARDGTLREVERHEPTGALHLASQLASAKSSSRRAAVG